MSSEPRLASASAPLVVGRYAMFGEIASGGMATVHLGCVLRGPERGRPVALKRLRSYFVKDREFLTMFLDEARIVARIRHPNVVSTTEVVQCDDGMFLVMEYVHGESLASMLRTMRSKRELPPPAIAARVVHDMLVGLHGAHETRGDDGALLEVVHRDVSPQNVMVGVDGISRVLDFGVAKATGRAQVTREGQIKGKLAYMAPEQVRGQVDRRTDVFAAAVVLWETLTTRRLHEGMKDYEMVSRVVQGKLAPPSQHAPNISPELDAIVMRGLAAYPEKRHATASELARDLVKNVALASAEQVAAWCESLAEEALAARSAIVDAMPKSLDALAPSSSSALLSAPRLPETSQPHATDSRTASAQVAETGEVEKDDATRVEAPSDELLAAAITGEDPAASPPVGSERLVAASSPDADAVEASAVEAGVRDAAPEPVAARAPSSPGPGPGRASTPEAAPVVRRPSLPAEDEIPAGVPRGLGDPAMRPYFVALVLVALLAATLGVRALLAEPAEKTPAAR